MYNLYDFGNKWKIEYRGYVYEATDYEIFQFCITILGIDQNEIKVAIQEMENHNHNAAHFGVLKKFISTFVTEGLKSEYH